MAIKQTENLAELYFARLRTESNSGLILAQFYSMISGKDFTRSEIILMNRLIKVFGKNSVFMAIVDISKVEGRFDEFPYGLLFKICRDRLENSLQAEMTTGSYESLDKRLSEFSKEMGSVKKVDVKKASMFLDEA